MLLILFLLAKLCHFNSGEEGIASPSMQVGGKAAIGILDNGGVNPSQPFGKNWENESLCSHCQISTPNFSHSAVFLKVDDCFERPL